MKAKREASKRKILMFIWLFLRLSLNPPRSSSDNGDFQSNWNRIIAAIHELINQNRRSRKMSLLFIFFLVLFLLRIGSDISTYRLDSFEKSHALQWYSRLDGRPLRLYAKRKTEIINNLSPHIIMILMCFCHIHTHPWQKMDAILSRYSSLFSFCLRLSLVNIEKSQFIFKFVVPDIFSGAFYLHFFSSFWWTFR